MDDRRMDELIAAILRLGVSAAAILAVFGCVIYLRDFGRNFPNYGVFRPAVLRYDWRSCLLEGGLLILILTPVARVIFSVFAFAREKDHTYVVITLIVLALLAAGWLTGRAA